jgi:ATP-dependent RNA helicase DeaD
LSFSDDFILFSIICFLSNNSLYFISNILEKNIHSEVTKIYINAGKKKKIRVIDIVGAFSNLPGINNEDIGVVEVQDLCSYVDILNYKGEELVKKYKEISIKKKMIKLRKDRQS